SLQKRPYSSSLHSLLRRARLSGAEERNGLWGQRSLRTSDKPTFDGDGWDRVTRQRRNHRRYKPARHNRSGNPTAWKIRPSNLRSRTRPRDQTKHSQNSHEKHASG